jgi:hypothetical protein
VSPGAENAQGSPTIIHGEPDLRRAHHAWFSDLLDAEHGDVNRPMMAAASPSAFGRERENIKAALVWALKNRRWRGVDDR